MLHVSPLRCAEVGNIETLHGRSLALIDQDAALPRRRRPCQGPREPLQLDAALNAVSQKLRMQEAQLKARIRRGTSKQDAQLQIIELLQQSIVRNESVPM